MEARGECRDAAGGAVDRRHGAGLDLQGAGIRRAHARRWTTFGVIWGSIVLRGQVSSDCT